MHSGSAGLCCAGTNNASTVQPVLDMERCAAVCGAQRAGGSCTLKLLGLSPSSGCGMAQPLLPSASRTPNRTLGQPVWALPSAPGTPAAVACHAPAAEAGRVRCRTVFYRERASGYYAAYPFALAQFLVEVPYLLLQTVLYRCASQVPQSRVSAARQAGRKMVCCCPA